jgi:hypothetical protein
MHENMHLYALKKKKKNDHIVSKIKRVHQI